MPNAEKLAKKQIYFDKLINLLETYPNMIVIHADHVGSKQMQEIRIALRGRAVILMGKNTMVRHALRSNMEEKPELGLDKLLTYIKGNIGFVFCISPMDEVRKVIEGNRVVASAKAGTEAQCDVKIPAGPSGLDPSQTSFFQALNIGTKIVKGAIEITSDVTLFRQGEKVNMGAQVLLQKLGIRPFEYGMEMLYVYDHGSIFEKAVLDITDDVLVAKFCSGVANVAAFGREVGIPTAAGLPHMMANAFKNIAALVSDIDFNFKQVEDIKKFLADPEAMAAAAAAASAPAAGGGGGGGGGGGKKAEAKKEEVVEEEEEDMDFDLFG